jgi:hypothetical protein
LFVWPARLPKADGRRDNWAESALEAMEAARRGWVRMQACMGMGAYEFYTPLAELTPPQWPQMGFQEMLRLAFRGNLIDCLDHIVLRQLRGEV